MLLLLQWFSMVPDHWSNDAMVSMDCCGLVATVMVVMLVEVVFVNMVNVVDRTGKTVI